jgi:hypothetical protein
MEVTSIEDLCGVGASTADEAGIQPLLDDALELAEEFQSTPPARGATRNHGWR